MPVEFILEPTGSSSDTARLSMMYDGSGRRISKMFLTKSATAASWDTVKVTHYTGIGTEVREEFHNGSREKVNVVVNMPQGLGRYKVADASQPADDDASMTFEWYLKNHLGSTMLVYGTVSSTDPNTADIGETKAAYDYRAFGEMVTLSQPSDKVTENFTGKERDDETKLNYFGARYLDPMLGMWISLDPKRQFASPYLYVGNGYNPIIGVDDDGSLIKEAVVTAVVVGGLAVGAYMLLESAESCVDFKNDAPRLFSRSTLEDPITPEERKEIMNEARDCVVGAAEFVFGAGEDGLAIGGVKKAVGSSGQAKSFIDGVQTFWKRCKRV